MRMRNLYKKSVLLLILLFAVGWTEAQTNPRGSIGALNGVFSVSQNTQVCFSKGNLQYKASTNTWRFALNQWDYVGGTIVDTGIEHGNVYDNGVKSNNNLISSTYDGWIDLFGWGTSGYNHGAVNYQPWAIESDWGSFMNSTNYYAYGDVNNDLNSNSGQADWGYNAISNGGDQENQWRTLTKDEWVYLINTRSTPSGIRFVHATVNGVIGLILLPDNWDSSIYTLNDINNGEANASAESNVLNVAQWNVLEDNGAVFLPKNGYLWMDTYSENEFNYWSSTHYNGDAYTFTYNEFVFQSDASWFRAVGMGVRLVKNASTETSYLIRAIPNSSSLGTVEGSGTYNLGETCTLTAIPNEDCVFISWTIDGEVVSEEPEIVFRVNQNLSLVANFQAIVQYTLNVSANPSYAGKITGVFDFEDGKQGWTAIDNDSDGHNWMLSSHLGQIECHSGNGSMVSASWEDESITPDNWLVSPPLELGGSVSLWARGLDPEYVAEHFAIYVSTNSNSISDFTQISEEFIVGSEYVQYSVDLSAYSGMGFVAIRHFNCTDMYYLDIDDITIVSSAFSMKHQEGKACSFSATPSEGQEFYNWTEDSELVSTDAEYSFTVTSDRSLVANFSVNNNSYEITATASPEEGGGVTGGGTYIHGAICTLTATPNDGFVFSSWTEDGETVSTNAIYSFMATQERNFVAVFSPLYTITAAANPVEGGSVSFVGITGDTYDITIHDGTNTNEYVPLYGYYADACLKSEMVYPAADLSVLGGKSITSITFYSTQDNVSWGAANFKVFLKEVNSTSISDFSGPGTIVYMGPLNISGNQMTVNFNTPYYYNGGNLLVGVYNTVNGSYVRSNWYGETVDGSSVQGYSYNGLDAISPTQRNFLPKTTITYLGDVGGTVYVAGDTCTVQARPMEGYEFVNWTENGEEVSTDIEYSFTVTGDRNLVANFDVIPLYTITAYPNPEEGGSVEGEGEWYKGETCTLIAYANEGYQFDSWGENGEVVSESPSYTFTVLSDRTLEAYFVESQYYMFSLATTPQEGGTIMTGLYTEIETPFTTEEPVEEQDISIVARANEGWRFAYWTSNDEVLSANNVFTFHLSENTDLVAHFEQCEVNPEPDPDLLNGRFSISGCTTVGFAKGNVIAQIHIDTIYDTPMPTSASWQFADTQYYRQEYDADYISENGIGELLADGMDLVWDVYRYLGVVDIGCWHQLSGAEWDYLLNQRDMEVRYAFAEVNDVVGLLILPDNWNISYVFDSPNTPASYETNIIPLDDWESILEPAGALFLPANGAINGNNISYIEDLDGSGIPVGFYGKMIFHPVMGILNEKTMPSIVEATAIAYYSMRLAQIMDQATSTVTASIEPTQTEYGMVSGGGDFSCGDECTVLAMANDGYVFRYWLDGAEVVSLDAEYTFTIEGDRNLIAVFADENAVCTVEFELVSGMNGLLGWGGEALQLNFGDNSPSIILTIPAPENDWNAIMIALSSGQSVGVNDLNLAQSRIFTFPINKETSVEMTWLAPSNNMGMNMSNSFTARYINGETIIENAISSDLPSTFQCRCEDIVLSVDPEEGGYVITEGNLSFGEEVTVTAIANEHFAFSNWTFNGIEVSTEPTYSFTVTEPGDLVAHFELLYDIAISVSSSPEAGGMVSGNGMYSYGSICTVTAVSNENYSFMYWTENGNVVSSNASYSFTVNNDRNLVALFTPPLNITATPNLSSGGVITGTGEYGYGSICTLTASPNEGYLFLNWSIDGVVVGVNANYSFTVIEDKEIEAVFMILNGYLVGEGEATSNVIPINSSSYYYNNSMTQQIYMPEELGGSRRITSISFYNAGVTDARTLDIYIAHTNNETFSNSTIIMHDYDRVFSGSVTFNKGYWTTVSLSKAFNYNGTSKLLLVVYDHTGSRPAGTDFRVFDAQGNQSISIGGDYSPLTGYSFGGGGYSTLSVKNQVILNQSKFNIGTSYCYNAGSVSGSGYFNVGETCTLTAVPNEGFSFLYWSEDGEHVSTDSIYSFTVASNRYLTAHFTPFNITVNADPVEGGTVLGAGEYDCNSTCTLTALPNEGYTFVNWTCDGNVVSTETTYSFSVIGNAEYVAHFALPFDVSVTINPMEGGYVIGDGEYDYGTTCTLTVVPNEGYMFLNWINELGRVVNDATYSFTVTADAHFTANFEILPKGVYVGTGGSVAVDGLPSRSDYSYCISQQIYTPSEIGDAMEIYNLSFYNAGGEATRNYEIFMVHTDIDSIDVTVIDSINTGWINLTSNDLVFSGYVTMNSGCWTTINLNTSFNYDGVSNLAIIVNDKTGSGTTSYSDRMKCRVYKGDGLQAIFNYYGSTMYDPYNIPQGFTYYTDHYKNQIILNSFSTITAVPEPEQGGVVTGAGDLANGILCTLRAIPNDGYFFLYWTEADTLVSYNSAYSFTVTDNRNFVAHFAKNCVEEPYYVYVSDIGFTEVTIEWYSNNNLFDLRYKKDVEGAEWTVVTDLSTYNYTITGLEDMDDYVVEVRSSCGDGIGYSEWASCMFNNEHYTINVVADPIEGGAITGDGTYWLGQDIQLQAVPNENYSFLFWTENEEIISFDTIYYLTVTSDRSIVAHFAANEQNLSLNPGWTWLSSYIEMDGIDGLGMLENGLNPNGVMIKSQRDGFVSYANEMWMGTLENITNEKMYLVNTNEASDVTFTGPVANMMNHPITLNPNWTWLGYPVPFAVDINDALANLNASEGDVVKTQSSFATYSTNDGWSGSLNQLTPGMGLMYQSHNSQPVTFNYGVGMSRALKANLTAEHNHWVPDIHAYPNNMSIMAVVKLNGEELQDEGYELAVFNGSECRGSARLAYVPSLHRYVAFLTVTGEDDVELYLALYDTMTGKAYYNMTDCPNFEANAVLGSLSMPFVARFGGTTDVDEWDAPNIELYPNPVVAGHLFQMEMPAECQGARVSIVNALGAVISTTDVYDEPATLRAPAVPGVYTVRIVTDKQGTFTRKLIVNK